MKIYWEVSPVPTGRYRSFERRGWPCGFMDRENERCIASIACEDYYEPRNVKSGNHKPLSVYLFDRRGIANGEGLKKLRLKRQFKTLDEVKRDLPGIIDRLMTSGELVP